MSSALMSSVKVERLDSPNAEAGTSTKRRRSGRFTQPDELPKEEEDDERELDEDEFVVERIIARSLSQGISPWGREYQYLVRWAGYKPKDDTWEWSSNLIETAGGAIAEFNSKEHPFSILDCDTSKSTKRYLFEMCDERSKHNGLWSPLAQSQWIPAYDLQMKTRVSPDSIKRAIKEWEQTRCVKSGLNPGSKRKHEPEEDYEEDSTRKYTRRVLLEILDDHSSKKYTGQWRRKYRVRHQLKVRGRGLQIRDEWYSAHYLLLLFGSEVMREKLQAYMPQADVSEDILADGTIAQQNVISDYEQERLKRMKENEDLIKELGLT